MISKHDVIIGLRSAGIEPGMTVFTHSNIAFFGRVQNVSSMNDLVPFMLDCFREVLGPDGTLVVPVFTYSFGPENVEKVFDLQHSLSKTSAMGNWLISTGGGIRSADPMLSVIATGSKASALTADIDPICFGSQSIWARLHTEDALICNLNLDSGSTFLHWVEREFGVSYRSDIPMNGTVVSNGQSRQVGITYTGRDLNDQSVAARFETYHAICIKHGISTVVPLGRGQIVSQRAQTAKTFLESLLTDYPYLLTSRHKP